MSLRSIKVGVPVLMLMMFQSGNCHNSITENGLMNLFYDRWSSGQGSMAPVAAPQQTGQQRDVQVPEVNTGSLRIQSSAGNEQFRQQDEQDSEEGFRIITLEEKIEGLCQEMAELRMASSNKYPRAYGYNYPDGVNNVEFNQHVDGASNSQEASTVYVDSRTKNQQDEQDSEEGFRIITLEEKIEGLCQEMAELRMASSNKYPRAYGYNYPDGVNNVEFNQHVDGASNSQEASTVYVDSRTKKLQDQFIREQQGRINGYNDNDMKEMEYQVALDLVNKARKDVIDFLDGNKNENVEELLSLGYSREEVADKLRNVWRREMMDLEKIGSELKDVSQEVEARRKEGEDLFARLNLLLSLPESMSIDGKVVSVPKNTFRTNSVATFKEDAKKSFTREDKGGTYPSQNGTLYNGQCAINSLCLSSEEERKIPDEIRKELNDKGGIQSDASELWEQIADSVQKRIFVYEYQNGSIVRFFEYGRSYEDLRRVCGEFEYDKQFEIIGAHYQKLV